MKYMSTISKSLKKLNKRLTDKIEIESISIFKCIFILFYYFVVFKSFIPQFTYQLQCNAGIYANTLLVQYQVLAYLFGLIPILIVFISVIIKERLSIVKFCKTILVVLFSAIVFNLVFNLFISFINNGEFIPSQNQSGLNQLYKQNPLYYYLMVVILAPTLEEIVYRGVIFNKLREYKSFYLAALVSSFVFGFMHVSASFFAGNFIDFTYLLLYASLGLLFCITYEYNKSVNACILMHIIYNAYTVLM